MPHHRRWALLLPVVVLLAASLACGGFQVRVTPTPTLGPGQGPTAEPTRAAPSTPEPTAAPTQLPQATPTTAPMAAPAVQQARVLATGGLNMRESADAKAKQVGRLGSNALVTVLEGPTQADNYDWYRVDNGAGVVGWIAAGPQNDPWLRLEVPAAAGPTATPAGLMLVDRAIQVGDRVQVTTDSGQVLTVRTDPGRGAKAVAKVPRGTLFTIKSGPVQQDNLTWWELESDTVDGWAAAGDGTDRWLTPVE
jgi:SH3-like domain-containing protein